MARTYMKLDGNLVPILLGAKIIPPQTPSILNGGYWNTTNFNFKISGGDWNTTYYKKINGGSW